MKNKQGTLVLAVFLSIAAPAFADGISAHLGGPEKHFVLAEGFAGQQDFQDSFARHNTLMGSVEENEARSIAISGALVGFHVNQGVSSEGDKVKIHEKHHGDFGYGNGNSNGNGGSASASAVAVAEPGSQTLLLFGLTGLGMFFYRRNYLRDAI